MYDPNDYYAPWEWQPIERMPDGCNDVIVRYEDLSTSRMCSCDYWWSLSKQRDNPSDQFKVAVDFRYE